MMSDATEMPKPEQDDDGVEMPPNLRELADKLIKFRDELNQRARLRDGRRI